MPAETDTLDPHATSGWSTYQITYQIFEGLVKEDLAKADDVTPTLVPGLATSWDISPDGLTHTFHLREGVKFHDGTPVDAAAAKFNFDRFWNESSPDFCDLPFGAAGAWRRHDGVAWAQATEAAKVELRQALGLDRSSPCNISPGSPARSGDFGKSIAPQWTFLSSTMSASSMAGNPYSTARLRPVRDTASGGDRVGKFAQPAFLPRSRTRLRPACATR
jgi:hypothetical protein